MIWRLIPSFTKHTLIDEEKFLFCLCVQQSKWFCLFTLWIVDLLLINFTWRLSTSSSWGHCHCKNNVSWDIVLLKSRCIWQLDDFSWNRCNFKRCTFGLQNSIQLIMFPSVHSKIQVRWKVIAALNIGTLYIFYKDFQCRRPNLQSWWSLTCLGCSVLAGVDLALFLNCFLKSIANPNKHSESRSNCY